jgi:hypothetical protein
MVRLGPPFLASGLEQPSLRREKPRLPTLPYEVTLGQKLMVTHRMPLPLGDLRAGGGSFYEVESSQKKTK